MFFTQQGDLIVYNTPGLAELEPTMASRVNEVVDFFEVEVCVSTTTRDGFFLEICSASPPCATESIATTRLN